MGSENDRSRDLTQARLVAALVFCGLIVASLVRGIDHDESQYVAAVALMRSGLPYRDFAYLQTPLQPLLLAPMAYLPAGVLLIALRFANALFAAVTAAFVFTSVRGRGSAKAAALAAAALAMCDPFIFIGCVARNDALPMLMYAVAIVGTLGVLRGRGGAGTMAGVGLALGAAISTKISYAVPAAAMGLFLLVHARQLPCGGIIAAIAGGLIGLAPSLAFAALAPEAFRFGVFDYSLVAPQQWRAINGDAGMLTWWVKSARLIGFLALGPALPVLALTVLTRRGEKAGLELRFLDVLIVAGLLAAFLPDPTYRQYVVPILPPLFIRFGLSVDAKYGRGTKALAAFAALAGLVPTLVDAATTIRRGSPIMLALRDAEAVRSLVPGATVATLSPERIAGRNIELDPRFAAGPFLFRTELILPPNLVGLSVTNFAAGFAASAPDAILVGGETRATPRHPRGLDQPLIAWATANGYTAHVLPSGDYRLFIRRRSAPRSRSRRVEQQFGR